MTKDIVWFDSRQYCPPNSYSEYIVAINYRGRPETVNRNEVNNYRMPMMGINVAGWMPFNNYTEGKWVYPHTDGVECKGVLYWSYFPEPPTIVSASELIKGVK